MSDASIFFILGLVFTIPVTIVVNVLQPRIERTLALRSARQAKPRAAALNREVHDIDAMRVNRHLLTEYLLAQVIRATLYGSVAGIVSGGLYAITNAVSGLIGNRSFEGPPPSFIVILSETQVVASFVAQLVAIIAAVLILNVSTRALRALARVQHYDAYIASVRSEVGRLAERFVDDGIEQAAGAELIDKED